MINPNTKVVPIDHGWANMKTEQDVFTSGVSEITTEPALFNDVLEYNNKYYKIGGKRLEVKEDKVHDDNYYLLTLAATAMTLERLHIRDAHVLWAVGLPLTRFGEEKDDFIKYLMRDKEVTFKYNKIQYHIVVEKVSVYPQCYAAVSDKLRFFDNKVSETIITESTSSLVLSDKDATGQDQCIEENPIIVLDITKQIDEADIWNMQGLLKEKNGISFGWYNNVDMMTKAIQVLANWNGVAMKSEKKHDNAEWVSIYVCMVKNLIEMCLARSLYGRTGGYAHD